MVTGITPKETEPYSTAQGTEYGLAQADTGARPRTTAAILLTLVVHSSILEGLAKAIYLRSTGADTSLNLKVPLTRHYLENELK